MPKRVQRYRVTSTVMTSLLGRAGELIVNITNNSLHVHDGITPGGFELGRADVSNIQQATTGQNGVMTISQVVQLNAATANIATNVADIATNTADIATNAANIAANYASLNAAKANKVVPSAANNIALLTAGGDLVDSGALFTTSILEPGTKSIFFQAAAPTGWTLDATQNDKVLRVNNTAGGGTGGTWTISGISVDGHALTIAEMPAHTHDLQYQEASRDTGSAKIARLDQTGNIAVTESTGGGSPHTHGLTIGSAWRPAYIDVIVCTKDAF